MLKEGSSNPFFVGQLYVGIKAIGFLGRQRRRRNAQNCKTSYLVSQNINGTVYGCAVKMGFISIMW